MVMDLITDRTQADVARLRGILEKGLAGMTEEEKEWLLTGIHKGAYEASDMNRVSGAVRQLVAEFHTEGTTVPQRAVPSWEMSTQPTREQAEAYLYNVAQIKYELGSPSELPGTMVGLTSEGANQIERLLLEVMPYLGRLRESKMYAGEVFAGEVV